MVHGVISIKTKEIRLAVEDLIWMPLCRLRLISEKNHKVIADTVKVCHAQWVAELQRKK